MEPARILPLLASLQMLPWPVSPEDWTSAPELTVSSQHQVFLPGESVTLTCSAPSTDTISGIQFFRDGQKISSGDLQWSQDSVSSSLLLSSVSESHAGTYSCESWKTESGKEIPSERSQTISIRVTAPLPDPQLTVDPDQPVYITGEDVTLTCSADVSPTESGIRFYRNSQEITSPRGGYTKSLQLRSVSAGQYSCESWKTVSGREIKSARSQPRSIRVTARPPAPKLTVSPQHRVFLPGEYVTLMCWAPSTDTASGIRFFRDGKEISSGELQTYQANAKFLQLSSVSETDAGVYSCEYWKKESEREIPSERSQTISINLTTRPPAPKLTVSSQHRVFLRGESVTLTCSAPNTDTVSGIRFFRDGQIINSRELQWSPYKARSLQLSRVSESHAGVYSCDYLKTESEREIPSERSQTISITVTASLPVPQITVSPSQPVYITGEDVTLTCSADGSPTVSGIRFYRNSQEIQSKELPSPRTSHIKSLPLSSVSAGSAGQYSCESWKTVSGREIKSARSKSCSIRVTDPPPQPELSVDPPSGAVSEGFPLNITCMAPKDARKRRFHFYKDGVELIPGDLGSEISTMEPSNSSVKCSVLSIPWAGSNITGEFACRYEENVSGRWILSPRSWTVNVTGNITVSGHGFRWIRELAVGGSFFLINGIIFLISCCYF